MLWLQGLVDSHPVLRKLPLHVKQRLVVEPGGWKGLPATGRTRKKMKKDGLIAYVYSEGEEGFTRSKAIQQLGESSNNLLEIDVKRGPEHDMMNENGPYSGLLRAALEAKLKAWVGSPRCRAKSVLRHYQI